LLKAARSTVRVPTTPATGTLMIALVGLHKISIAEWPGPVLPPEDIAGLVSYLVRDESKFVTGMAPCEIFFFVPLIILVFRRTIHEHQRRNGFRLRKGFETLRPWRLSYV
jgi:hypothetical protein